MGDGLSTRQCMNRWHRYLELQHQPTRIALQVGAWQPDEVPPPHTTTLTYTDTSLHSLSHLLACVWQEERLLKLVRQHVIPSYWSDRLNTMTQEYTDWKTVGMELGRDCNLMYKSIHYGQMKKGPFTAEEDALRSGGIRGMGCG